MKREFSGNDGTKKLLDGNRFEDMTGKPRIILAGWPLRSQMADFCEMISLNEVSFIFRSIFTKKIFNLHWKLF